VKKSKEESDGVERVDERVLSRDKGVIKIGRGNREVTDY